jgi:hypothetical protein
VSGFLEYEGVYYTTTSDLYAGYFVDCWTNCYCFTNSYGTAWRSLDQGQSWSRIHGGAVSLAAWDDTLLALENGTFLSVSADSGATWTPRSHQIPTWCA